jgi:hypothetical protein
MTRSSTAPRLCEGVRHEGSAHFAVNSFRPLDLLGAIAQTTGTARSRILRRGLRPTVSGPELFPELINAKLDKKDRLPPCSALEALERQEPFVNQTLAYQALAMLARLFRYGRLTYHGGFVNLRTGCTTSLPIDPAVWERIKGAQRDSPGAKTRRRNVSRLLS